MPVVRQYNFVDSLQYTIIQMLIYTTDDNYKDTFNIEICIYTEIVLNKI